MTWISQSFLRWIAIVKKELIQLKRDRVTLAMIIVIPIIQLTLFGFAINTDPKHLPTAIVSADHSVFTRSFITAMQNSSYFELKKDILTEQQAKKALNAGDILFVVSIPVDFTRKLLRNETPEILLEADATDPNSVGGAVEAITGMLSTVIQEDFRGVLARNIQSSPPYSVNVHRLYNPEKITQYNIIPGLIGTILTFTLVMMTAIAITRERERGTMEQLLAMPIKPYEIIIGKIVPYIFIGLVQATIIIIAAKYLFSILFFGGIFALYVVTLLFIIGSITMGVAISTFARNQMQSMQFTIMILLPSILLSGFMFPFLGMPYWAQCLGQTLPLTYFVRLVRGIMLKGSTLIDLWPNIWPLLIINIVVMTIAIKSYRKTLD
jgi:ABC-2 type transport system permease protein